MPIKFSPSVVRVDRNTKKTTIEHDYMKVKPLKVSVNCWFLTVGRKEFN